MDTASKMTGINRAFRCLLTALLVWAPLPADALSVVTSVPNGAPLIGPIAAVGGVPLLGSEGPTGISVLGGLPGLSPKTPSPSTRFLLSFQSPPSDRSTF